MTTLYTPLHAFFRRPRSCVPRAVSTLVASVAVAWVSGCSPSAAFCAKKQECNDRLEDDTLAVCIEDFARTDRMLRANDEEDCHRLADAQMAFHACLASLDCRDLEDQDFDDCEAEQEELVDAADDAGGECLSTN